MRVLACSILATAMMSAALPARAQTYDPNYPVCMQITDDIAGGGFFDCSFTSLPQCAASASGRAAHCVVNPYYAPVRDIPPPRARKRHRHVQQ
jgi:hypothetical protein